MESFKIYNATKNEFDEADPIYKIIIHENSNYFSYLLYKNRKYYISYFSPETSVDLMYLSSEKILLLGVDLKVVFLSIDSGSILFSMGLYSLFKGFQNTNELFITIFSETEDIIINKNGFSISQIISHDLEL